ncbi:MAG: DUF899 family protein [Rhodospirillales bacterium]|nr:DUF899 family protein [Rhodospirillales bacterium]
MVDFHDKRFPGESDEYRIQRNKLIAAEIELRKHIEQVAAQRRRLPVGGRLKEDYVFEEGAPDLSDRTTVNQTSMSALFADGKDSLVVYSFMYGPQAKTPCPMCTSLLDSLNGAALHIRQRVNLAVVAKAPVQKIRNWAMQRNWENLRLLSSGGTTYNADYFGEAPDGDQISIVNVFQRTGDVINHTYNSELIFVPPEEGQNPRHVDTLWPLWNVFDLTPEGRGEDWFPRVTYD